MSNSWQWPHRRIFLASSIAALVCAISVSTAADKPQAPAGIYKAEQIASSPLMTASGLVWWKDRLIISDRGGKRLVSFTPPDRFETFLETKTPVGVAVDADGNLILSERDGTTNHQLVRIKPDGSRTVIAEEDLGSPHFVCAHANGTIYWSGFPDGGTRSLPPKGKARVHLPKIGHTYGICLSPNQDALFVGSKVPNADGRTIWRFPLDDQGTPGEGKPFVKIQSLSPKLEGLPAAKDGSTSLLGWVGRLQGMTVDRDGNFYIGGAEAHTAGAAVAVISKDGKDVLAMILGVPPNVTNVAFGGKDGRTLFIVGSGEYRLFQVQLPLPGAQFK